MRVLFMGTPDFAAVSLRRLVEDGHEICGVFTQPDKPGNRKKMILSAVKEYALSQSLPVYQPARVRDPESVETVRSLAPELIVVAAYGQFLPQEILDLPKYGSINVHASLLPKYRGAAPINWAILNDEAETGVSIMYMVRKMDAGDVLRTASTVIEREETLPELWARLAELGAQALSETIPALADGTAARTPQDEAEATYAPMLSRELSPVDWSRSARAISCQIRGLIPWPCASTEVICGEPIKLWAAEETGEETSAGPGTVVAAGKRGIDVACGDGRILRIRELQAQGGKRMTAAAYLAGHPIQI